MKKTLLTVAMLSICAAGVMAQGSGDYSIDESSIRIEVINDNAAVKKGGIPLNPVPAPADLPKPPEVTPPPPPSSPSIGTGSYADGLNNVNATLDTIDKIINLAQKVWDIIKENQPVVDISVNYANAVPYGLSHWTQLQGWSRPATKKYSFFAKNKMGTDVVKVTYQVTYTYGGNLNGKGKFLTGVAIEPINVETAWGYKVNLKAEVPDSTIANVGTSDDPIAAMQVQLKWIIHTPLQDTQQKAIYYVQGDGLIQEIGTPFKGEDGAKKAIDRMSSEKF
ncbi:MAG: hypothetical protein KA059_00500 [Elusimicrobiales bacterium]|jgi:hypothetical protein|nr:hypothetical protein [Elusimicrobiales bacterium]NLH38693.1 hypothetical protein [Elusimicrobiota bacterium]